MCRCKVARGVGEVVWSAGVPESQAGRDGVGRGAGERVPTTFKAGSSRWACLQARVVTEKSLKNNKSMHDKNKDKSSACCGRLGSGLATRRRVPGVGGAVEGGASLSRTTLVVPWLGRSSGVRRRVFPRPSVIDWDSISEMLSRSFAVCSWAPLIMSPPFGDGFSGAKPVAQEG